MDDKELIEELRRIDNNLDTEACSIAAARLTALAEENERLRGALETAKDDMLDMLGYVTLEGNGFSTVQERDEWFASDLAKIDTALAPAARKETT